MQHQTLCYLKYTQYYIWGKSQQMVEHHEKVEILNWHCYF